MFKKALFIFLLLFSSSSFAGVMLMGISGDMEKDTQKTTLLVKGNPLKNAKAKFWSNLWSRRPVFIWMMI